MFHRTIWRLHGREIPEGHEINHLCNNRACCNIDHLECIPRDQHLEQTNKSRYSIRKDAAKAYWKETNCTGTALAEKYVVSFSIGCRWIREWKAETPKE